MSKPRIEIVSGPSCSGKSVYIGRRHEPCHGLLFLDESDFSTLRPDERYLVHYNLLRPFDAPRLRPTRVDTYWRTAAYYARRLANCRGSVFKVDRPLIELLNRPARFHVTVLVASLPNLLARIEERTCLEPLLASGRHKPYETARWERIYQAVKVPALYHRWLAFLRDRKIAYTLVDANSTDYAPITSDEGLVAALHAGISRRTLASN